MLAIEMSDARGADYASIHAAGCSGMRDAQNLPGEPTTLVDVANAVEMVTGWGEGEYDADDVRLKPCAAHAMRKAAAAAPAVVEPVANVEPDESTDVELHDESGSDDDLAALRMALAAAESRAAAAEAVLADASAARLSAEQRATDAEARAESLTGANRRLNETVSHMVGRFEAQEAKMRALRVAVAAVLD